MQLTISREIGAYIATAFSLVHWVVLARKYLVRAAMASFVEIPTR